MSEDARIKAEEPLPPTDDRDERDALALQPTQRPQGEARGPIDDDASDPSTADRSPTTEPASGTDAMAPAVILQAGPTAAEPELKDPLEADESIPVVEHEVAAGSEQSGADSERDLTALAEPEHRASIEEDDSLSVAIEHAQVTAAQDNVAATRDPDPGWERATESADPTEAEGSDPPSEGGTRAASSAASPDNLGDPPVEDAQSTERLAVDPAPVGPESDIETVTTGPSAVEPAGETIEDPIWQSQEAAPRGDDGAIEADAAVTAPHTPGLVEGAAAVPEDLIWSQPEEPDEATAETAPAQQAAATTARAGTSVALWQEADPAIQQDETAKAGGPAAAAATTLATTTATEAAKPPPPPFAPPAAAPAEPTAPPQEARGRSIWSYAGQALRLLAIAVVGYAVLVLVLVVLYRWVDPPTSNLMLTQRLLGTEIEQRWIPLRRISPHLVQAVILSEDGAFCRHRGVDWLAMEEAIESSLEGTARGGSTITMQLVKNLFLWSSRSFIRKAIEIPLAYLVELLWPKHRVLEIYLNIVEWGDGVFGADAAARHHFGKPASQLTQQEAALLAVSLPNPIERTAGEPGALTKRLAANLVTRMKAVRAPMSCLQTAR